MTTLLRTTLASVAIFTLLGSSTTFADHNRRDNDASGLLRGIASILFAGETAQYAALDRPQHSLDGRRYRKARNESSRRYRDGHFDRNLGRGASYTSEPIRGGSSRSTRIVENPYPNRPITGISFTGIERAPVHINDVITYPRKRLISRRGYSLSLHHPSRFLNTHGYVDYISVKAKRREYFTVTFHYN